MSVSGGSGINANNAQSLAAEGVVERGRWVLYEELLAFIRAFHSYYTLHPSTKMCQLLLKCLIYRMHIYNFKNNFYSLQLIISNV